jgi:AcrR family transcriptional regulator
MAETMTLENIKVSDICQEARISRSTFYRLFEDKYDVINWNSKQLYRIGIVETGRTLTWSEGLRITLSGGIFQENLWREAAKDTGYNGLQALGIRTRKESLLETITAYKHLKLTKRVRFQIDLFADAESLAVTKWINNKNRMPLTELCTMIESCVPQELYELVKKPVTPRAAKELTMADMIMLASKPESE